MEIAFIIFYKPIEHDPLKDNDINEYMNVTANYTINDDGLVMTIEDLKPFTNYTIKVAAYNLHGIGPFFNLTCMSGVGSMYFFFFFYFHIRSVKQIIYFNLMV